MLMYFNIGSLPWQGLKVLCVISVLCVCLCGGGGVWTVECQIFVHVQCTVHVGLFLSLVIISNFNAYC